jgi:magnesium chelatase family protein
VLPSIVGAAAAGFSRAVVPPDNAAEALLVPDMQVVSAPSLGALIGWLRGDDVSGSEAVVQESGAGLTPAAPIAGSTHAGPRDLADVVEQPVARRAAE